jgi:hypothetical protein
MTLRRLGVGARGPDAEHRRDQRWSAAMRSLVTCLTLVALLPVVLRLTADQATAAVPGTIETQLVGPGRVSALLRARQLTLRLSIRPNRPGAWNTVLLTVSSNGRPTRHAAVTVDFTMLSMSMGTTTFRLSEARPGQYTYIGPATVMSGDWRLAFHVRPQAGTPVTASVEDHVGSR